MNEHELNKEKKEMRLFALASTGLIAVFSLGMVMLSFISEQAK
jgi:hypothetical protein